MFIILDAIYECSAIATVELEYWLVISGSHKGEARRRLIASSFVLVLLTVASLGLKIITELMSRFIVSMVNYCKSSHPTCVSRVFLCNLCADT
jgi:hypothetical protein